MDELNQSMLLAQEKRELLARSEKELVAFQEAITEEVNQMMNTHEKLNIVNDILEAQLDYINSMVPKEEFRNVNNTPKHLLHMTDEDMQPVSAE